MSNGFGFGFSKSVEKILELLGGAEGLTKLNAYGLENWATGIMFRVNRGRLDLYAVISIIPDNNEYLILVHYTDRKQGLKEVTVSPHELRHTVESLLEREVTKIK